MAPDRDGQGRVAGRQRDPLRVGVVGHDRHPRRPHRRRQREGSVGRAAVAREDGAAGVERRDRRARHHGAVLIAQSADDQLVGAGRKRRRDQRGNEGDPQEAFTSVV